MNPNILNFNMHPTTVRELSGGYDQQAPVTHSVDARLAEQIRAARARIQPDLDQARALVDAAFANFDPHAIPERITDHSDYGN